MQTEWFPKTWNLAAMLLALLLPLSGSAQHVKGKSAPGLSGRSQLPLIETQGAAAKDPEDQILLYRFRLDADSLDGQLLVTNSTDSEGTITLFAQEADSSISKKMQETIEPGAVFVISAADAGWSDKNVVSVKASRRLTVSLEFPGEEKATEIARDRAVMVYDVFGFGRQSELAASAKKRGLSLLYSNRRFSRELSPETTPQQGVSELIEASGGSPARGLFVLESNR